MCTLRAVYDLLYLPIDANPMGDRLLPPSSPNRVLFFVLASLVSFVICISYKFSTRAEKGELNSVAKRWSLLDVRT